MAYYAELDQNNVVTKVRTGASEFTAKLEEVYHERFGKIHKKTSYNTRGGIYYDPSTGQPSADQSKAFRKNYAGVGFSYDESRDAFIPPQPFPSWTLNETSCLWEAPVAMPSDGKNYSWNEDSGAWVEVTAA